MYQYYACKIHFAEPHWLETTCVKSHSFSNDIKWRILTQCEESWEGHILDKDSGMIEDSLKIVCCEDNQSVVLLSIFSESDDKTAVRRGINNKWERLYVRCCSV